jgi:putative two-component system response regulator
MEPDRIYGAKILIVDDHEETVVQAEHVLRKSGYRAIHSTLDSRQALPLFAEIEPDLLLLSLFMPAPGGFAILDQLAMRADGDELLGVIALMADSSPAAKLKALSKGAKEFLSKPLDSMDLLIRTRNLIEWRFLGSDLKAERSRWRLTPARTQSNEGVETGFDADVFEQLQRIYDFLDPSRVPQAEKTAELSNLIGQQMGLADESLRHLRMAARIYDVGMLALPDTIRNSERTLSYEELKTMKSHTSAAGAMFEASRIPGGEILHDVAEAHHERWDGTGYPFGLKATKIPLAARIVAVAQYYCAITSDRPYREALPQSAALEETSRQGGYAFDPEVVSALTKALGAEVPVCEMESAS